MVGCGRWFPDRDPEDHEPGGSRKGWQHEASSRVEQDFRESLFTRMPPSDRASRQITEWPWSRGRFLGLSVVNADAD